MPAPKLAVRAFVRRGNGRLSDLSGLGLSDQLDRIDPVIDVLVSILKNGREKGLGLFDGLLGSFVSEQAFGGLYAATERSDFVDHDFD